MTALIAHDRRLVAAVGATRAYLVPEVEQLPEGDPTKRFVAFMCLYALDVAAGRLPGPYSQAVAEAYAQAACGTRD
jgi:hypothetical protein